jgi:large subunit ribosomal protein L25
MKTIEIIGYKREDLGKQKAKKIRNEGYVPCVMYGQKDHVHFSVPMILFKELVYTPEVYLVDVNIEGDVYQCVLQDIQFHPVSEMILHADFLKMEEDKPVKVNIPVRFEGTSPGVVKGGRLMPKLRYVKIKALPKDLPDFIVVNISKMDMGKSFKVRDLKAADFEILNSPQVSIATVETPRAMRGLGTAAEEEAEETAEATEE